MEVKTLRVESFNFPELEKMKWFEKLLVVLLLKLIVSTEDSISIVCCIVLSLNNTHTTH